jgi:hypothetical protein
MDASETVKSIGDVRFVLGRMRFKRVRVRGVLDGTQRQQNERGDENSDDGSGSGLELGLEVGLWLGF